MATSGTSDHQAPWTVGRLLEWTTQWFNNRRVEGGRLSAELLLARALGCRKIELYTRYEQEPTEGQRADFRELVRQAGEHVPIAYLLGTREFFSLEFQVNSDVLIPRPETEALVERVIALSRQQPERPLTMLDIGTGSGCIAVAVARYAKNVSVVASDISPEALAVAARNIDKHQLAARVRTVQADLVALPPDVVPDAGFNLIVSNPPYISEEVFETLPANVRNHEPREALVGPNGDGLVIYRRLAAEAAPILAASGRVLVEVAHDQPAAAQQIFESAGWTHAGSYRNRTDPYDRVLEFTRSA